MTNPWLKKNPFLSMWLSAANAGAGLLRVRAAQHAKRQAAATTKSMLDLWTFGTASPPAKPRRRKRR